MKEKDINSLEHTKWRCLNTILYLHQNIVDKQYIER